ncbi:unnamed protein product [Sympodiomycopsis kandeliae]
MSVLLETSLGDLVLDLDVEKTPKLCENFLKLCKTFKYNYCAFFSVQQNFLAQTGDPTSTGKEGSSVWYQLPSSSRDHHSKSYFRPDENAHQGKHLTRGTVSMALSSTSGAGSSDPSDLVAGSQFFITLADNLEYLDGKHAPFATVVEGQEEGDTLDKINASFTDDENRPMRDIRINHVIVLDDPFPDPEGLQVPSRTPSPTPEQLASIRLGEEEEIEDNRPDEEKEEAKRKADSSSAALTLEMVGDLPFAEIRPPENILFVCKLNPITRSEDLELIFSRFGEIISCEVIKDKKTGDSLQYAFIEFDQRQAAEQAYFKMDNVLIDNQRIKVDFSQSVSKLHGRWIEARTGKKPPPQPSQHQRQPPPLTYRQSTSSSTSRARQDDQYDGRSRDFDRRRQRQNGSYQEAGRDSDRRRGGEERFTQPSHDRDHHRHRERDRDRRDNDDRRRHPSEQDDNRRRRDRDRDVRRDDRDRDRHRHRDRNSDRDRERDRYRDRSPRR